jgi:hypothetical protein
MRLVPDFGRHPDEIEAAARSITGQVYVLWEGVVMRGASAAAPSEAWDVDCRKWAPLDWTPNVSDWLRPIPEPQAEQIMWGLTSETEWECVPGDCGERRNRYRSPMMRR